MKKKNVSSLVFVGCMFLGGAIGMATGRIEVWGAAGMGVGFLAMAVVRYKFEQPEAEPQKS